MLLILCRGHWICWLMDVRWRLWRSWMDMFRSVLKIRMATTWCRSVSNVLTQCTSISSLMHSRARSALLHSALCALWCMMYCRVILCCQLSFSIVYCVPQKTVQNCFCQNFVEFPPTLIIFGSQIAQRIIFLWHALIFTPNVIHVNALPC